MKNRDNSLNKNRKSVIMSALAILAAVLAAGNVWTIFYYVPKHAEISSEKISEKYNLLNPARKFVGQKDLIINFQPLRDYLNDKYEADPNVSVYFEYLPTGANITISKDAEFYPASLLKVPIAMAIAKKIEKGEWKWDNELVLMANDKNNEFGTLYKELTGSVFTIEELVRRSLADSDNTAHFILARNLEINEVNDMYEHLGLKDFLNKQGNISAKRYSVIFRALYNSSYLSGENSQKLISFLSQSGFKDYLQSALPSDVVFAHKIGISAERSVYMDSGIVYLKSRPYLLTAMIRSSDEKSAKEKMKDISEKVYNYVRDYKD